MRFVDLRLLGVLASFYVVIYIATPFYIASAGGAPLPQWLMAGFLELLLGLCGICFGTAWESIQDKENYEGPLVIGSVLLSIITFPIMMHQMLDLLPGRWITMRILEIDRYRYLIAVVALLILVGERLFRIRAAHRDPRSPFYVPPDATY